MNGKVQAGVNRQQDGWPPPDAPSPEHLADVQRVHRIAAGDHAALADFYDCHAPVVYGVALRILRDRAEAEEIVQEVFAQAWREAANYDSSRGSVRAWLLIMSRTRAIDCLRHRGAGPDEGSSADSSLIDDLPAPVCDLLHDPMAARDAVRIRRTLGELSHLQRTAIELAFFHGLTHREIAERLRQPLGSVKTCIRLGLLRLRDALDNGVS